MLECLFRLLSDLEQIIWFRRTPVRRTPDLRPADALELSDFTAYLPPHVRVQAWTDGRLFAWAVKTRRHVFVGTTDGDSREAARSVRAAWLAALDDEDSIDAVIQHLLQQQP